LLTSLIANGNLVLEGIKPTLMITGSGGANALYPINKSLRLMVSALDFVAVLPSVKSVMVSLPAFLKP
jgi:hypothetical protein